MTPLIGINTVDDLTVALTEILAAAQERRQRQLDALDASRSGTQFQPARAGYVSQSHNVNMSPEAHAAFSRLSPQERGDLIERALKLP